MREMRVGGADADISGHTFGEIPIVVDALKGSAAACEPMVCGVKSIYLRAKQVITGGSEAFRKSEIYAGGGEKALDRQAGKMYDET